MAHCVELHFTFLYCYFVAGITRLFYGGSAANKPAHHRQAKEQHQEL